MHSALNYRQSRRSACDRCRGFKLRCERDQANGRSCERCLKAQVVCTTSVGLPTPNYLPSKGDSGILSQDCDRVLGREGMRMPVLHRSTASKVRKPLASSGSPRRQDTSYSSCWRIPETCPSFSAANVPSMGNIGLQMPLLSSSAFPVKPCRDLYTSSGVGSDECLSLDDVMIDPEYHLSDQRAFPQAAMMGTSLEFQNELSAGTNYSSTMETFNVTDQPSDFIMDGTSNSLWENLAKPAVDDGPPITTTTEWLPISPYSQRKRLLRLNLDLIDDLELLESGPFIIGSSSLLGGDVSPTVRKLDLPIFRMLSHATQFMDILETSTGAVEDSCSLPNFLSPSRDPFGTQHDTKSPSTDLMGGSVEDRERTTSSYDSAYLSSMEPSPEQATVLEPHRWDISTALSMVATYCHLIRVYRAVFTHLYQLFLIIPPADAAAYLLLPDLQFGQFHMDGNLAVQVQVLVELGSSMLQKIERTLGMSQSPTQEQDGEIRTMAYILDDSPMVYIRDHIMAQERLTHAIPLKETMNCLRQLLKDPDNM